MNPENDNRFDPRTEIDRCSMCATCTYVCPVFQRTRLEGHTARGHIQLIDAFLFRSDGDGAAKPMGANAASDASGMPVYDALSSADCECMLDGTVAMRAVDAARAFAPSPDFERMLDCCLRCYRCMDICPSSVHTVSVFEEGRALLAKRRILPNIVDKLTAYILESRVRIHVVARIGVIAQAVLELIAPARRVAAYTAAATGAIANAAAADAKKADAAVDTRESRSQAKSERLKSSSDDAFWFFGGIAIPKFAPRFFLASAFARARAPRRKPAMIAMTAQGAIAGASLEEIRDRVVHGARRLRVAYIADCMTDVLYPAVARDVVTVLEAAGCEVVVPTDAPCCGAPALGTGDIAAFARMARAMRDKLGALDCDYIVVSNPTCAKTMKYVYPERLGADFNELAAKIRMDFEAFNLVKKALPLNRLDAEIGWHDPCHQRYAYNIHREPRELLAECACYTERRGESECCGFGGTFCVDYPKMAQRIAADKGAFLDRAPETEIATTCPACLYYLNQHAAATRSGRRAVHLSEVVARAIRD
jgi:Fe-S oxidoreductase